MGFFDLFSNKNNNPDKNAALVSDLNNPAAWLLDIFNGVRTLSGEDSTHESAMTLDSYFAALRNISEDIAKLPLNVYEVTERGRKLAPDHFAFNLLHSHANKYSSTMDVVQTLLHWAISYGNGFAEIVRDSRGRPSELWPIHPSRVKPYFTDDQELKWEVSSYVTIEGQKHDYKVVLDDEDVFNLRGLGADAIIGYSVFSLAAESIGQGLAVQKFASAYFANGTAVSGILKTDTRLDKKAYQNMRESWAKMHEGSAKNKHNIAILEQGTDFKPIASTAQQAQLLESQKYTVERVARLLRIPPHKIGHNTGLVKANFEAESIAYFRDTLTPWIKRFSLEANRKILGDPKYMATHQVSALTLGDSKTRSAVFKTMRNMGTLSINEVRDLEELNVIDEEWADEYHMQSNITTVQNISEGGNMKKPGGDQPSGEKFEQGEGDEEPAENDVDEAAENVIDIFERAKASNYPIFKYTADRLVTKEQKQVEKKMDTYKNNAPEFEKWAGHFFKRQKADILEVFEPCVDVFISTFPSEKVTFNRNFLNDFATKYTQDGHKEAINRYEKHVNGDVSAKDYDKQSEKLANMILNFVGSTAKGLENETK